MKISNINICGFRGFNEKREIEIDERLTIIHGPNSYGKTSISEALEWLLLGDTSKVENSLSGKTEFKGSYRNIHFPSNQLPCIEVTCNDIHGNDLIIRGELDHSGTTNKFINNVEVETWPWESPQLKTYSPFILQHALQDLLLTSPSDRYDKFTKILGTQSLTDLQNIFNSLATKYIYPDKVENFVRGIKKFNDQLVLHPELGKISKTFNKADESDFIKEIENSTRAILDDSDEILFLDDKKVNPKLLQKLETSRKEEVRTIFDKKLVTEIFAENDGTKFESSKKVLLEYVTNELIEEYLGYVKLETQKDLIDKASFYKIGLRLVKISNNKCPFCDIPLTEEIKEHIQERHNYFKLETLEFTTLATSKKEFLKKMDTIFQESEKIYNLIKSKVSDFLLVNNTDDKDKIKEIFGEENLEHSQISLEAIENFFQAEKALTDSLSSIESAINDIKEAFETSIQKVEQLQTLNEKVLIFVADSKSFIKYQNKYYEQLLEANKIFEEQLDAMAGTQILAIQIELLEQFEEIKKFFLIKQSVASLKELRSQVTEYVSDKTKAIIEEQLTQDVMTWYNQIKTTGDPDVHFSGFVLTGTVASQRIGVTATSYGQELVSAVSSLSESKLNALGLSIKISNNLKGTPPFGFMIIDDPVQSLDDDHATQFSVIIRNLIKEHNKQIILLSHDNQWLKQVQKGNETINGLYYEITGYNKSGPHIKSLVWKEWKRRLEEVNAICNNQDATVIQLQQAEEEIRLAISQIASEISEKKTGKEKNIGKMNEREVRKTLFEAGIDTEIIDRISQTYETVDDAHHTPSHYSAKRERIKQYHSWVHELGNKLDELTNEESLQSNHGI